MMKFLQEAMQYATQPAIAQCAPRYNICCRYHHGVRWCLAVLEGQHPFLASGPAARAVGVVPGAPSQPSRAGLSRLMRYRIVWALLRSPLTLIYGLLCLGLSAIGFGGAYLLLTLGLQTFSDPLMAWLLAGFGLLWAGFWLYLLGVVLRAAITDDAEQQRR
jgi:hypothetical protein